MKLFRLWRFILPMFMTLSLAQTATAARTLNFTRFAPQNTSQYAYATFQNPRAVAVDAAGNIYVTDTSSYRVEKFAPDGTRLAKWGSSGSGDGQFYYPVGVAVDASGNVYVADQSNSRILKFAADGTFLTNVGRYGSDDGQFYSPSGVTIDASGNIYVVDQGNHRIQKFAPDGTFLTKWGSYGSDDGQFSYPLGVAVDASGNVYVADASNQRIQKFAPDGTFLLKWGSSGSENGQFYSPSGVAVDASGNVYVADQNNQRIQKFASDGTYLAKWGSYGTGDGQLNYPTGVAVDASGNVYAADQGNARIEKFAADGSFLVKIGKQGSDDGQFYSPTGVTADASGNVYVADQNNHRIEKFGPDGTFLLKWGSYGWENGQFYYPQNVKVDASGNVYVVDHWGDRIQKFSADGAFVSKFGSSGSGDGQFYSPSDLATDASGNVYVTDTGNHRIVKFAADGTFLANWGSYGSDEGQFNYPTGVAVDASGNVFVVDQGNHRVEKFAADGTFLTGWGGYGQGYGQFNYPVGVAVDASGNVYVTDQYNYRVEKFSSNGIYLGQWGTQGLDDGQFKAPCGVAIDASGNIFVADSNNYRIEIGRLEQTAPLAATLTNPPASPTNQTSVILTVGGTDVVQYQYRLDGGAWSATTPIATPIGLTLAEGSHTLDLAGGDSKGFWQSHALPTTYTWTVDATAPLQAVFSGQPASLTNSRKATITISNQSGAIAAYKWSLDGAAWSNATSVATKLSLSALSDGLHTLSLLVRDVAGNWQTTPTTYTWTVDATTPSETTFSGQPASLTNATTANFTIGNAGGTLTKYRWSTNGTDWTVSNTLSTPLSFTNLADGAHTVYLEVCDTAGNWQTTPTTYTWTVDTTVPTATVTTAPPSITKTRDFTLNVVAGDLTSYKFALDSMPYTTEIPVGTAINLVSLADGSHSLSLIGKDAAGNWQAEGNATVYSWTVDTVAPLAVITNTPANPTKATTASLTISGDGVVKYQYSLDTGAWQAQTSVASPVSLTGLTNGSHTVSVKGIDAAGNIQVTPTSITWTVDTVAPLAVITGTPSSPTSSRTATLAVSGTGVTSYKYRVDSGAYSTNPIPVTTDISLTNLVNGGHSVSVIAGDAAGNWQPQASATTVSWVVDTTTPTVSLSGVPGSPTSATSATITVGGASVNTYQYKLDAGEYGAATNVSTPISLSGLTDGSHTLTVKGANLAGTWQQTPTTATWVVDTFSPMAVLINAPSGSTNNTSASIYVTGTKVVAYKSKKDSGAYGSETPITTPITLNALSNGSHTLSVIARDAAGTWQTTPTTATWVVNTAAPTPTLTGVPTGVTNASSASITVGGQNVTDYQYKLDTGPWCVKLPVATPIALTDLGDGSHTLSVIGCNALGTCQSQAAPVTATWTVDATPPDMPAIPAAQNPTIRTTNRPTLVWTSVSGATDYLVEVADNVGFDNPNVQQTVAGATSYTLPSTNALTHMGIWFWRVRARNSFDNVSTWASSAFSYQSNSIVSITTLLIQ